MCDVGLNELGSACAVYALSCVPCGSLLSAVALKLEVLVLLGSSSCVVVVVVVRVVSR
jgi:hypothetical protein